MYFFELEVNKANASKKNPRAKVQPPSMRMPVYVK
jgi:hypothetical protein